MATCFPLRKPYVDIMSYIEDGFVFNCKVSFSNLRASHFYLCGNLGIQAMYHMTIYKLGILSLLPSSLHSVQCGECVGREEDMPNF
jgi:hypothetical protein